MFKLAKYYMLLNLYKRAKKNIIAILTSLVAMIFVSYIFSDIIGVIDSSSRYGFVAMKWLLLLGLVWVIVFNVRKMLKTISLPFKSGGNDGVIDERKEKLLAKEQLMSRSDRIVEKYRNNR